MLSIDEASTLVRAILASNGLEVRDYEFLFACAMLKTDATDKHNQTTNKEASTCASRERVIYWRFQGVVNCS